MCIVVRFSSNRPPHAHCAILKWNGCVVLGDLVTHYAVNLDDYMMFPRDVR